MEANEYDVIVVGAGISGLYAARCLTEENLKIAVLEGRSRVGGRAWTLRDEEVDFVDLGGAYFGDKQTKVIELAESLGLHFYSVPQKGKSIYYQGGKRKLYSGDTPALSLLGLLDVANCLQTLDRLSLQVPLEAPWNAPKADEWDHMTLQDFLKKTCWTRAAYEISTLAFYAVTATNGEHISLLDALFLIRSCGGCRALVSCINPHGLQSMKIKEGSNSISERIAETLEDKIIYNAKVTRIFQSDTGVELHTENGNKYQCKEVIVALCPILLQNIEMVPPLPLAFQEYVNIIPRSKAIKVVTYYDKAYWKDKGLKGEFVVIDGMVYYCHSDTKHDGTKPAIIGFVDGIKYGDASITARRDAIAQLYAEVFRIEEMAKPIHYREKCWGDDDSTEFSGICVYTLPPDVLTKTRMLWGKPFHRVKFAGVESSPVFRGYMDGGIRAAERAVKEVLDALEITPSKKYDTSITRVPYLRDPLMERYLPSVPQALALVSAVAVGVFAAVVQFAF